jgi:hypothetical protein
MPSAGHSSMPTARTVSYSAASSPARRRRPSSWRDSLTRDSSIGAASRLVMASATAMRPEAGASSAASGVRSPMAMASPAKPGEVGQRDRAVGHRHLPGADHLVAVVQAAHRAVADGDQEALAGHRRVAQHGDRHLLQLRRRSGPAARNSRATRCTSRCILGGLPSSTSIGMSITGARRRAVLQHQLALVGGRADHRKRAALALAHRSNSGSDCRRDGQHIAFLAFVAPDLLGRQAALLQRHGAQVERAPGRRRPPVRGRRWTGRRRRRRGWPGPGCRRPAPSSG